MNSFVVFETNYWIVSHRKDSRYQGYLIVASTENKTNVSDLSIESQKELGVILAKVEKLLISVYSPKKVIITKFGFSKGYSIHFHLIPATEKLLNEILDHPKYTNNELDGNDVMLFVSREYCESKLNKDQNNLVIKTVNKLREKYNEYFK